MDCIRLETVFLEGWSLAFIGVTTFHILITASVLMSD